MFESEEILSLISIYSYNDSAELTRYIAQWASSLKSAGCETLKIGANNELKTESVSALLGSNKIRSIKKLQLDEIYLSAEDFERLLTLPNLVELEISGGSSSDYGGSEYTYSTLTENHYRVLATSPHAKKLRSIILNKEVILGMSETDLQNALPNLTNLSVF